MLIELHPSFLNCGGKLLGSLIAGSNLYGLSTKNSDVDYRGLFLATDKKYITGFDKIESIVTTGDIDSAYYELVRYFQLLRKSNTQVLEIIFSPDDALTYTTPIFQEIRDNKYKLIDSRVLKASLKGYVFSELRLATGERLGKLGGARKLAVDKYGFSYKNFVQILRLIKVGKIFFSTGEYMVKVKDFDPDYHDLLMELKTTPENFTKNQLSSMVDEEFKSMVKIMDESKISFKFDVELASDLVIDARSGL